MQSYVLYRAIARDIYLPEWYNSQDGWLRIWQVGEGFRSLTELSKIAVLGFINNLRLKTQTSEGQL